MPGRFRCEERDGYAWVYVPGRARGGWCDESALPAVPEVPKFSATVSDGASAAELPCNVDHGIIGLMDPAHGPFVHQAWWWRSAASIHEKTKQFEPLQDDEHGGRNAGFAWRRMRRRSNSAPYKLLGRAGTTTIDFVLPNRRYETIRAENEGQGVVFDPDDGDAGDGVDVPDRCGGGVEYLVLGAVCDGAAEVLWRASLCGRTRRR